MSNTDDFNPKDPRSMFKSKAFVTSLLGLPTDVKDEALLSATAGLEIALTVIDLLKESIVEFLSNGGKRIEMTPEKLKFVIAVSGAVSMKSTFDEITKRHRDAVRAASVAEKGGEQPEQPEQPTNEDVGAAMEALAKFLRK